VLRPIVVTAAFVLTACKPTEPLEPPAPPPATQPEVPPADAPVAVADAIATVGTTAITAEQLERHLATNASLTREQALFQLIDRIVFAAEAGRLELKVRDSEIDRAAEGVAKSNGMTVADLRSAVAETTPMSWEQYREEVGAQILEMKVMTLHGAAGRGAATTAEELERHRQRLASCLWVGGDVTIHDPGITARPNPYDRDVQVAGARFTGTLGLPEADLQAVVAQAAPAGPACAVLTAVEPALLGAYTEAGYVRATIMVQWPDAPPEQLTLDITVDAGAQHVVGAVSFEQDSVPAADRIDAKLLASTIETHIRAGDVAAVSKMRAAGGALNALLAGAGLAEATPITSFRKAPGGAALDVTYVISP